MTKDTAIILGATGNIAFTLGVVLLGLKKHNQKLLQRADIFVYWQNFDEGDLKVLSSILPITLIPYKLPKMDGFHPDAVKNYGEMTFVRYECFKYLKTYSHCLWLDSDILIKGDISGMLDVPSGIGFRREYYDERINVNFTRPINGFDMNAPHYNAGIMSISRALPFAVDEMESLSAWCYKKTAELAASLWYPDQGVLLLMCQHFNFKITPLEEKFNCEARCSPAAINKAVIVHAVGHRKFWKYYYFKEWFNFYKEWLSLGGAACGNNFSALTRAGLSKRAFFQVAPDPGKYPVKFLLYCIKGLLF